MSLRRLFAPLLPAAKTQLTLAEESHHHAQVLRLSAGDAVQLFGLCPLGPVRPGAVIGVFVLAVQRHLADAGSGDFLLQGEHR